MAELADCGSADGAVSPLVGVEGSNPSPSASHATPRDDRGETDPVDHLARLADHSSAFLTVNTGMRHYAGRSVDGLVAYRDGGRRHAFELCGPFALPRDRPSLLREFRDWTRARGRRLTALQLSRTEAELYAHEGFTVNQMGSTYSLDTADFHLRGTRFMRIRNKLSRARRQGVTVESHPSRDADPELDAIDSQWLAAQGRHAREFKLMVGERGGPGAPHRRIFVARHEGRIVAYASYSPVYGERPGWLYDLTRRVPDAPVGAIEAIFVCGLETVASEGARWLHLGLTPFAHLSDAHELDGAASRWLSRAVRSIGGRDWIYPTSTQLAFKMKWAPTVIEPEYIAFEGSPSLGAAWQLARTSGVV